MSVWKQKGGAVVRACGIAICAGAGFVAASGLAQGPVLAMLDRFEPGLWEVQLREGSAPAVQLCLDSGRRLIQIRHPREACQRLVIEDKPGAVTVQYSCPANGYGRTSVRFENPRLAQIETQGIDGGLPFNFVAEARRIGSCMR